MKKAHLTTLITVLAPILTEASTIIVQEDFSGALNGTAAEVFLATGTGNWVANANFTSDGAFASTAGENTSAHISVGEYINNTKGDADGSFTLEVTFQRTAGGWFGVGFSSEAAPSVNGHFLNNSSTGTVIQRSNNELDVFTLGSANGAGFSAVAGVRTVSIELDLTDWNGTDNFGSATYSADGAGELLVFEYAADTDFESLLLSGPQNAAATISSLTLTQVQVPEPSSLILLSFGGLMIARRRR